MGWGRITAVIGASVLVAAGFGTASAPAAGAASDSLERGVVYDSLKFDEQQIRFFVLSDGPKDSTNLVVNVDVTCGDDLTGHGTFPATVDRDGRLRGKGAVSDQDGDDSFTDGSVAIEGTVAAGGIASGTISFDLLKYDQMDRDDERGKCKRKDDEWTVRGGDPDEAIGRIEGAVDPQDDDITDGFVPAIAADADAVYFAVEAGVGNGPFRVVRVDPKTGKSEWNTEIDGEPRSLVVGDGAVWVATGHRVLRIDSKEGNVTKKVDASWVAIGPDGAVWVANDEGHAIRKLDPATGNEQASFDVKAELTGIDDALAAGPDAVYTTVYSAPSEGGSRDVLVLRLDPATGATTTHDGPGGGGSARQLVADGPVLWVLSTSGLEVRDAKSLAVTNQTSEVYPAYGSVVAAPGLWVPDYFSVYAVDGKAQVAFDLPWLGGPVAAAPEQLWVYDSAFGLVRLSR